MACGTKTDKSSLTRIVATAEGVRVDRTGRMRGRGGYLCLRPECGGAPVGARRLSYALRTAVSEAEAGRLVAELREGTGPGPDAS